MTNTEIKKKALALYKGPFNYSHTYIFDANHEMVMNAHQMEEEEIVKRLTNLQVRGWGRISYMENPEALQDAAGELIAQALTKFWEREQST